MKKSILTIAAIVTIAMAAVVCVGYELASREAVRVTHMAYAMEREGSIDQTELERVKKFVKRQYTLTRPYCAASRMKGMRYHLQRIRRDWHPQTDNGTYGAYQLEVCFTTKMED